MINGDHKIDFESLFPNWGGGSKRAEKPRVMSIKEFCLVIVKEYSRLVLIGNPMDWSHTFRDKGTSKEYKVTVTMEQVR